MDLFTPTVLLWFTPCVLCTPSLLQLRFKIKPKSQPPTIILAILWKQPRTGPKPKITDRPTPFTVTTIKDPDNRARNPDGPINTGGHCPKKCTTKTTVAVPKPNGAFQPLTNPMNHTESNNHISR
ncbi:hypothetical protein [Winogradskyella sp.]|uniref:hypothetical protein n=1 Tax=Winogradskyella sp. TaxID=1883156 RepID=UPI003BAA5A82